MKIERETPPTLFTPVTITLETKEELGLLLGLLGNTAADVLSAFGVDTVNNYGIYDKLCELYGYTNGGTIPRLKVSVI